MATSAGRADRQSLGSTDLSPLCSVPGVEMRRLEHRLRLARSVREVYELGLQCFCSVCACGQSGLVTVDAECLDRPAAATSRLLWSRTSLTPAWSDALPLQLDEPTAEMIKAGPHRTLHNDLVAQLVEREIGVRDAVVGRVRLYGHVVALLITSGSSPTSTGSDAGTIADDIATLMSVHLERIVEAAVSPALPD